jgi:hypothetical protein
MAEPEIPSEREKWEADLVRRDRDLEIRENEASIREKSLEKEVSIKEKSLDLQEKEARRSRWSSPLVLAVVGAALAALGNAVVTYYSGVSQRELESRKTADAQALQENLAESQRILEMIKTGSPDKAAENLRFLLETKLVSPTRQKDIASYLRTRKKGEGAALSAGQPSGPYCNNGSQCASGMACVAGVCLPTQ